MIPWIELDRTSLPLGGELRLMRRGHEFSIKLGVAELMTSRLFASEAALATLAAEKLNGRPKPRVLIGGLGMGFTLRAPLGAFGTDAQLVVAELVPAVLRWARGPMAERQASARGGRARRFEACDLAQRAEVIANVDIPDHPAFSMDFIVSYFGRDPAVTPPCKSLSISTTFPMFLRS